MEGATPAAGSSGSLLSLFSHPEFDAALLFEYLYKSFDTAGVHTFLTNRMFSLSDAEVEQFVPQILCMLVHRKPTSAALERFVLDRCARSVPLALKFTWYLQSYVEDESSVGGTESLALRLHADCEAALVNGAGDPLEKVARSEYFSGVTRLVERLMRISGSLRAVLPREQRSRVLHERLASMWRDCEGSNPSLPLWSDARSRSTLVRLPPGEAVVLHSRDRVPFMVFFEALAPSEAPADANGTSGAGGKSTPGPDLLEGVRVLMKRMEQLDFKTLPAAETAAVAPSQEQREALEHLMEKESSQPVSAAPSTPVVQAPETWDERKLRIGKASSLSNDPRWDVVSFIVKYGDDCRQELLAVQLLGQMKRILDAARLPLWLYPHGILVVGKHSALIETIPNVKSIHQHKKTGGGGNSSVSAMFAQWFGDFKSLQYERAQKNFVESLAGYSVASFLLQIKDRHNGNLLIDSSGHIIHIDFGFMLGQSPGGISFESAPFKLVPEWVELMGGPDSDLFHYFEALLVKGFHELIKHKDKIVILVEMMLLGKSAGRKQPISCLQSGVAVVEALRARFDSLGKTEEQILKNVVSMVSTSLNATSTGLYDRFQFATNAILF